MMHQKPINDLIDIKEIYLEPTIKEYARGREILAKYPQEKFIEASSHWTTCMRNYIAYLNQKLHEVNMGGFRGLKM